MYEFFIEKQHNDQTEYYIISSNDGSVPDSVRGKVTFAFMKSAGSKMFSTATRKFVDEKDEIMIRLKSQPIAMLIL
jgi:hypothetical protein